MPLTLYKCNHTTLYIYSCMAALVLSITYDLMLRSRNGISIGRTYSDFNFVSRHVVADLCRCCFCICMYALGRSVEGREIVNGEL